MRERPRSSLTPILLALLLAACSTSPPPGPAGSWRAALESPGGEIPFALVIEAAGDGLGAKVLNGDERAPFSTVRREGSRLTLRFDHYDSEIVADMDPGGRTLSGTWTRQSGKTRGTMPFRAERVPPGAPLVRFAPPQRPAPAEAGSAFLDVSGDWDVVFTDEKGESPARAEFRQEGTRLLGTFLTPTGDHRYLEGDFQDGALRLSCFDGAHAFLFTARMTPDGNLQGDWWSRSTYHAAWVARRAAGASPLPDSFAMTGVRNPTGRLAFSFPALDGTVVGSSDERFKGKVVIVEIFGSWCPNCNDQAPDLVDLYRRYHDRGLEIVGLAYEMTGDPARDAIFVDKYAKRHGITYPLLLAGTSDKIEASATLPDLDGILAFPTLIFIDRDGKVAAVHTGFEGPGTGPHHETLVARYASIIEGLL